MADPSNPNIVNFLEIALEAKSELEAAAANKDLSDFQKNRFKKLGADLDRVIARLQDPADETPPEQLAEFYQGIGDEAVGFASEIGFEVDDFSALNEDAFSIVTGQPADPGIGIATDIIVGREEPGPLRNAQLEAAAKVLLTGGGTNAFIAELQRIMEEKGIEPPANYAGRPLGYAEMVSRTLFAEIQRARAEDRGKAAGTDLGQISIHGARDACRFFEGVIFSYSGATKGYPTLASIKSSGHIFHPNCKHSTTNVVPALWDKADLDAGTKAGKDFQALLDKGPDAMKAAFNAANAEAAKAMKDAWDSTATEEGH